MVAETSTGSGNSAGSTAAVAAQINPCMAGTLNVLWGRDTGMFAEVGKHARFFFLGILHLCLVIFMELAYDLAFGPDGEPMTVAQLLVTLLRGTHKNFYDALLQNLHVHEGVDDLDVDTLLTRYV